MTTKSDFTAEEWKQLLQAPVAAGTYIIAADPSFVVGGMQEAFAVSSGILKKVKDNNSSLLADILADFQQRDTAKQAQLKFEKKDIASIKETAADGLKGVARILEEKVTEEESKEMKTWLYDISVQVANAAKEDSILGFGGTKVSEAETAALKDVENYLKIIS